MIKLFFLIIFVVMAPHSLKADEAGDDPEFTSELDNIKNPFEDGLPKPVVVEAPKPVYHAPERRPLMPRPVLKLPPRKIVPVPVVLPDLKLQGVMVGADMHAAIINDQIVSLKGTIEGARVDSVSKQGVELSYKGKKFFLKLD